MQDRHQPPRLRRSATAVVAAAVLAVLAACSGPASEGANVDPGASNDPTTSATTSPEGSPLPTSVNKVANGPQPPSKGVWVGAWVKPQELSQEGRVAAVNEFQSKIGRTLDVVHVYHDWDEQFPTDSDRAFAKQGSILLLSWAGTDTRAIQTGQYDELIRQQAQSLKQWGAPVLLEWRWEMDRPNLSSQIWSATDYIAAWKRIRGIFAEVGVPNAGWVWCPLAVGFDDGRAQPYYPGDDQVDWVCADVYPGKDIKPFATGAKSFLDWAKDHPKPIIIGEFGMKEARGEHIRQAWLTALRAYAKTQPQIKALVYFNADNSDADKPYNMDLLSSPGSLAAFRGMALDPYYNVRKE
jgi:hypothetical protein